MTSSSESAAAPSPLAIAVGSFEVGNRASRSLRRADRPVASARSAPIWRCWSPPAAVASDSRPERPAASRVGSTMPVRSGLLLLTWLSRSFQPSFAFGQPSRVAIGSGIATTTGLRAIEAPLVGANAVASFLRRSSQVDESGIQTSGATAVPGAWPTPARTAPCLAATTAATSTGSEAVTLTAMQVPPTAAPSSTHCVAASSTAGASSEATATVSWICPEQEGCTNSR